MVSPEEVVQHTNRYAAQYVIVLLVASLSLIVYFVEYLTPLRVPWICVEVALGIYAIALLMVLLRHGQSPCPPLVLYAGILFMVGGTALDVGATIISTPTLARESNPIARALLDSGHSLAFVYACGLVGQVLVLVIGCLGWAAFLRHRDTVIQSAWDAGPQSAYQFCKAALGAGHLTSRQYFLPLKLSELSKAYHMACAIWAATVGAWSYRWYLGLNWLHLVPEATPRVIAVCLALGLGGYHAWLCLEYARGPARRGSS